MITESAIEAVRDAARENFLDIVQKYVPSLKKKNPNDWWAKSPFNIKDKTPSFHIRVDKGFFKCWSTGQGGDAISFVQTIENGTFLEAIKIIAELYNIPLEDDGTVVEDKSHLYDLNKKWHDAMRSYLMSSPGILKYLVGRGMTSKEIREYELGYCPEDMFPHPNGMSQEEREQLMSIGIVAESQNNNLYIVPRGRITFPIKDFWGKVCGFTCRAIDDNAKPKYLNTPETAIYKKGSLLEGLYYARTKGPKGPYHICEGPMDRIPLLRSGKNAVATCGTAFTTQQAKLIKRCSDDINLCYDGDTAGHKATLKHADMLLSIGSYPNILQLEPKQDPGDITEYEFLPWYKHYVEMYKRIGTPELRAGLINRIREAISYIDDDLYKREIAITLAEDIGIQMDHLLEPKRVEKPTPKDNYQITPEYKFLRYMVHFPDVRQEYFEILNTTYDFDDPGLNLIFRHFFPKEGDPEIIERDILDTPKTANKYAELHMGDMEWNEIDCYKTTLTVRLSHIDKMLQDAFNQKVIGDVVQAIMQEKGVVLELINDPS